MKLGARGRRGGGASSHPLRRLPPDHGLVGRYRAIAFLQEWVVPRYSRAGEEGDGHGYGLEVFHYVCVPRGTYPRTPIREGAAVTPTLGASRRCASIANLA